MKQRYYLFPKKSGVYYLQDRDTGQQKSLGTKDRVKAEQLQHAKNHAAEHPALCRDLAKAYASQLDPRLVERTWTDVFQEFCSVGKDSSRSRRKRATASKDFNLIRQKKIFETTVDDFRTVLKTCGSFNNKTLKDVQNLAIALGWSFGPLIAPKHWPSVQPKLQRAITLEEHNKIIAAEKNPERRLYYELLWEIGSAQTDGSRLRAENIDWSNRRLIYYRLKTGEICRPSIGSQLKAVLKQLPSAGFLFPKIQPSTDSARASEFSRRCRSVGITGVTLHCYRISLAERCRAAGMPERFAQEILGHKSKAVTRAYAKNADLKLLPLEFYEAQHAENKVIQFPSEPHKLEPDKQQSAG